MLAFRQACSQLCGIGQKLANADGFAMLPGDDLFRTGMDNSGIVGMTQAFNLIAVRGMLHKCTHPIHDAGLVKVRERPFAHAVFNDEHQCHQRQENKVGED